MNKLLDNWNDIFLGGGQGNRENPELESIIIDKDISKLIKEDISTEIPHTLKENNKKIEEEENPENNSSNRLLWIISIIFIFILIIIIIVYLYNKKNITEEINNSRIYDNSKLTRLSGI